ncbi:hypothetical protein ECTPHS_00560 [Ectothiorhodospira sp. PHS-1]|nr:hypothetical protein [Ectothiorhodospira sp. PHS-1]EHQ51147.1 hypothetical protein ECTPHS_00560 [Ectothiorhodospira sp. PHS-1]
MKPSPKIFPRRALGAAMAVGAMALSLSLGAVAAPGGPGAADRDMPR